MPDSLALKALSTKGEEMSEERIAEIAAKRAELYPKDLCRIVSLDIAAAIREALADSNAEPKVRMIDRASDSLALAVFDWVERGIIKTRSTVSDALQLWAATRFDVTDRSEIVKLREFAKSIKHNQEN